jgi:hypothetical protein
MQRLPSPGRTLLVALLVVASFEVGLRLVADRLETPLEWYSVAAQVRIGEADRVAAEGIQSDVLFVGTSMVRRGVQVEVIEDHLVTVDQAHNAALPGAQVQVVRRWLTEEMVPRLNPERVVWGVSALDFNSSRLEPTIDAYDAARSARTGWVGVADRAMADLLVLSRHRAALRDPVSLARLAGVGEPPPSPREERFDLDELLAPENHLVGEIDGLAEAWERCRAEVLNDWGIADPEIEALRATIGFLREQEIEVVVILMPVPDRHVATLPDGEEDFAEFLQFVARELDALGVTYFDYSRSFEDEDFHDLAHLNGEPAQRFSEQLAHDLAAMGW